MVWGASVMGVLFMPSEIERRNLKRVPTADELISKAAYSELASIGVVVNKIVETVRNPHSSATQLKEMIEIDPPLSAKVLRRANSAFYGIKRNITSIREAIVFLGFNTVREIALNLKVLKFFEDNKAYYSYSRKNMWVHSLAVALFCKFLYRREFRDPGDYIYSAGLLHDIGIIAEEQFTGEYFQVMLKKLNEEQAQYPTIVLAEKAVFGFTHADIGRRLTSVWNIPDDLTKAIGSHHEPFTCDPAHYRHAASIFIADYTCRKRGFGLPEPVAPDEEASLKKCLESLKLIPESIDVIFEDVKSEIESLEARGELYS